MIAQTTVIEVRRLLALHEPYRHIASQLGVSRQTVERIASGRRLAPPPYDADDQLEPPGLSVRCPGCGGRVYLPCRLCSIRRFKFGRP